MWTLNLKKSARAGTVRHLHWYRLTQHNPLIVYSTRLNGHLDGVIQVVEPFLLFASVCLRSKAKIDHIHGTDDNVRHRPQKETRDAAHEDGRENTVQDGPDAFVH